MHRAVQLTGSGPATFVRLTDADLPDDPVTVAVTHSGLNYKDGLAVTGRGRIARSLPMVCGIDLAGTVTGSADAAWRVGDEVVVTGWGLSETRPGGYTERQRLPAEVLLRRPAGFTAARAMAIGTAGVTAMLAVLALEERGVEPGEEVLVTGAAGGVGSLAVVLLSGLGYRVTASTGRSALHDRLRSLGASDVVDRAEFAAAGPALGKERWAGAVDTVGSTTLAAVLSRIRRHGAVAACGLAGGSDLPTTVFPFLLRGVALLGIDSVYATADRRRRVWERLGTDLSVATLDGLTTTAALSDLHDYAERILAGDVAGRVVFDVTR